MIDAATVARIRVFEDAHPESGRLAWPARIALAFGAFMLGTGVLLFVSAHWDTLSPLVRFSLVLSLTAVFHVAGAAVASHERALATTLHALGTVALGAGIFLTGQIFNLHDHWPGGLMLWALGAALGWGVLRDLPQMALTVMLAPAWLVAEWIDATNSPLIQDIGSARVAACGVFLLALAYFTAQARRDAASTTPRDVLSWIGAVAFAPAAISLAFLAQEPFGAQPPAAPTLPLGIGILGWTVALGLPLAVARVTRPQGMWMLGVAALWTVLLSPLHSLGGEWTQYGWWALGGVGLVAWGVRDMRVDRINMGAAVFASTVLAFYFSHVMGKLGRSASLVGFGLLFLAGGTGLERLRRRLVRHATGERK
jgi:uncharacterized membrane protein